uniref:BTSP n=1 Tax=Argas monolakensis TaxID=34602 RepID=Q09JX1_ARGMO|nr:BTSP [Argas monolakensis]
MKHVLLFAVLAVLVLEIHGNDLGVEFGCPEKAQPPGEVGCMYFCRDKTDTKWVAGIYRNGSPCEYSDDAEGACQDGLCHYKGPKSGTKRQPATRRPPSRTTPRGTDEDEWEDK